MGGIPSPEAVMTTNAEMLKRAYQILPGNSLGSFYLPEGHEFVIERGAGSKVHDVEGREYLDYVLEIDRTRKAVEDTLKGRRARA
jgi:glutamate-1-semialdehyde aminotransferase